MSSHRIDIIRRSIANAVSARDFNFHKLRLNELIVNKRYVAARKRHAFKPLPKDIRRLATLTSSSLFQSCAVCLAKDSCNIIFSDMVTIGHGDKPCGFVCRHCAASMTLPIIIVIIPVHTLSEERFRVWLYRVGLVRKTTCPCCKVTPLDIMDSSWHVAHDIARVEGGTMDLINLFVTCGSCNLAMQSTTIGAYMQTLQCADEEEKTNDNPQTMALESIDGIMNLLTA